jgi:hypothetical protein
VSPGLGFTMYFLSPALATIEKLKNNTAPVNFRNAIGLLLKM